MGSHGHLLKALTHFGKKAVPHLLRLLDSHDSDVRFYATFLFSELKFPEALDQLVLRLFDRDRQVRAIALDVIRGFQAYPEYRWAVKKIADELDKPSRDLETKQIAAGVLGELGERSAIEILIKLLNSVDAKLLKNSHRALVKICFQDFGYSEKIWSIWYAENRARSQIEWAIDGLTSAGEPIRIAAHQALMRMIGTPAKTEEPPANMLQFKQLQQRIQTWWREAGREIHQRKESD